MVSITATPEALMRQAHMTADTYLQAAIVSIDDRMGEGASKKYPQIVAALIQASAQDFHTSMMLLGMQDCLRDFTMDRG
jgi:hypothetical protein